MAVNCNRVPYWSAVPKSICNIWKHTQLTNISGRRLFIAVILPSLCHIIQVPLRTATNMDTAPPFLGFVVAWWWSSLATSPVVGKPTRSQVPENQLRSIWLNIFWTHMGQWYKCSKRKHNIIGYIFFRYTHTGHFVDKREPDKFWCDTFDIKLFYRMVYIICHSW